MTLEEVLAFYNRGGNFHELNLPTLDPVIAVLGLTVEERTAVVAFLRALTDDRVRFEMAPFDHPQLFVPNGHPGDETKVTDNGTGAATDALLEVSAVSAVGDCVGIDGTPRVCDDHNPCTTDSCQPHVGCMSVANPLACDDGNPCTDDSCDPVRGCAHNANTRACNDGNACTADRCRAGVCVGTPIGCDDANPCTDDSCDAVLGCVHTPNTDPCNDGNACTTGDRCAAGTCRGAPLGCDDGNPCTDDLCDPVTGGCAHTANTSACDDGDPRTVLDHCEAGVCVSGPLGCPAKPVDGCRISLVPQSSSLQLKKSVLDSHNRLIWRWQNGQATRKTDFGNPAVDGGTNYAFCVYDEEQGVPRLVMGRGLPAGGTCGGLACWREGATGFSYRDRAATHAPGLATVTLRGGPDGLSMISVQGRGRGLEMLSPPLHQDPVVRVQLIADGVCWQSDYRPPALTNEGGTFQDIGEGGE